MDFVDAAALAKPGLKGNGLFEVHILFFTGFLVAHALVSVTVA